MPGLADMYIHQLLSPDYVRHLGETMGHCSHQHQQSEHDPLLTLSCYLTGPDDGIHVTVDHCNELADDRVAILARALATGLNRLADALTTAAEVN
jgi:hypothetical protein